jgi:hypothetical protein
MELCVWWNLVEKTRIPVSQMWTDGDLSLAANTHSFNAVLQGGDNISLPESESVNDLFLKFMPFIEHSVITYGHGLAAGSFDTLTDFYFLNLYAASLAHVKAGERAVGSF